MTPGKFTFITGPMFCGKTEELIRIATRYTIANKRVLVFKPKKDKRYGTGVICSHNQKALLAHEITSFHDILPKIHNHIKGYQGIFVDEIQFINDVNITEIRNITDHLGINLYVAGLTLDSFRVPFEGVLPILPYAEIIYLESVCNFCGSFSAKYTYRKSEESTEQLFVGGKEAYCAICANCLKQKES
jgi:thymidine kinase